MTYKDWQKWDDIWIGLVIGAWIMSVIWLCVSGGK